MSIAALEDVAFHYPGGAPVLHHCTLRVSPGERVLLRGPNGSGKSTILRLLVGDLEPTSGRAIHHRAPCHCCALLGQEPALDCELPVQVRDVVANGWRAGTPWWRPRGRGKTPAVEEALELVGLSAYAKRSPADLSGGQRRRMLIARTLVQGAGLLLLDEPLSGLDAQSRANLAEVLNRVTGEGHAALVLTSHEIANFPLGFDRDLHLDHGHLDDTAHVGCEMVRDDPRPLPT